MKSWETSAFTLAVFVFVKRESMLLGPKHFPDYWKPGLCREDEGGFLVKTASRWGPCHWWGGGWLICALSSCWMDWHLPHKRELDSCLCWLWHWCQTVTQTQGQRWGLITAASLKKLIAKVILKVSPALCVCRCPGCLCPARLLPCPAACLWAPCCHVFHLIMTSWQLQWSKCNFTFDGRDLFPHVVFWWCLVRDLQGEAGSSAVSWK